MAPDISSWARIEEAGKVILKEKFMTATEVAALLRYDLRYLRSLARDGKIPGAFKFGGQWLFSKKEIQAIGK